MFRGNLRAERVFKNLEFYHALVLFCRDASLAEVERWDEFASWVLKRRSQYTHLVKFLSDRQVPGKGIERNVREYPGWATPDSQSGLMDD